MGANAISGSQPIQPQTPQPQALKVPTTTEKNESPWGMDISPSLTMSGGRYGGASTGMIGARIEIGKNVADAKYARAAVVGDVHGGIGNGMEAGVGLGVRGELGTKSVNLYGSAIPEVNMGVSSCEGPTGGLSLRTAAGVQYHHFFGEAAHTVGTNMNMTTVAVGLRVRF